MVQWGKVVKSKKSFKIVKLVSIEATLRFWILITQFFKGAQQIQIHLHFKRIKIAFISDVFHKGDFIYFVLFFLKAFLKSLYINVFDTVLSFHLMSFSLFFKLFNLFFFFYLVWGNFKILLSSLVLHRFTQNISYIVFDNKSGIQRRAYSTKMLRQSFL